MGVRRLIGFMARNGLSRRVSIEEEIHLWKRQNPEVKPTIILDVMDLVCTDEGILCGGSCREFDKLVDCFFDRLVKLDVQLVFVQKPSVEIVTHNGWIKRRNDKFEISLKIYNEIENGDTVSQLMETVGSSGYERRISPNLIAIASKYGEFLFVPAFPHSDRKIVEQANNKNAMAILSRDNDFLIFEGNWKWWNCTELNFEDCTAMEYDRLAIDRFLSITWKQRPLLATLIGNGFTKIYSEELYQFQQRLGRMSTIFENVAHYIRRSFRNQDLSEDDFGRIAQDVYGFRTGNDKRKLIRDSCESYRLDMESVEERELDPIEVRLTELSGNAVNAYRDLSMNAVQTVWIPFYDMPNTRSTNQLIEFFIELTQKKMGIIHHDSVDGTTFKLITKKSRAESFVVEEERIITPNVQLPPLIELLTHDDSDDDLNNIRWNLLAWLLSITAHECVKLRSMDKDFRLPCATLLVFVKRGIMTEERADGILVTEMAFKRNQLGENRFPEKLNAENVRAAHIYRIFHAEIMYAFMTAGLIGAISELFRFDSVYYQNLTAAQDWPHDLVEAIDEYRIYSK